MFAIFPSYMCYKEYISEEINKSGLVVLKSIILTIISNIMKVFIIGYIVRYKYPNIENNYKMFSII